MHRLGLVPLWKREFAHYSGDAFRQDVLAGLTVAAVALPLALAFGVACGATAAAGLVTAILAGLVIGALSGAPYQISGPTGAMSAILIVISQRFGMDGIWIIGVMAGVLLLAAGALHLGRFIAFVPAPVIAGFTAGIAAIIFIGQLDPFLGVPPAAGASAAARLARFATTAWRPDPHAVAIGSIVILTMVLWPQRWQRAFPGSLAGIVLASLAASAAGWHIARIGEIPRTIFLNARLSLDAIPADLGPFVAPALSVAALGAVESLLCGAVGSRMTGIRLGASQELIAQGIGNVVIPFFGGVPATAAIARSSVAIRSGGHTRLTSIVHALALLASALLFAPLMAAVPLAALAGVLLVTSCRMIEWPAVHFLFANRFKGAILTFSVTLIATVVLDLTQAILIGATISAAIFINAIASLQVSVEDVDPARLRERGIKVRGTCPHVRVAHVTGPLFFAATGDFNESFARLDGVHVLILSMRGVPAIDVSGLEALGALHERMRGEGRVLLLSGVHDAVRAMLRRGRLLDEIGEENLFWGSDQAIVAAEERGECPYCG